MVLPHVPPAITRPAHVPRDLRLVGTGQMIIMFGSLRTLHGPQGCDLAFKGDVGSHQINGVHQVPLDLEDVFDRNVHVLTDQRNLRFGMLGKEHPQSIRHGHG